MPKKTVDSMTGIRIELQQSERDALESYLATGMVKNVGEGIGAAIKPILDNLGVIIAALVATEGLDRIESKMEEWQRQSFDNQMEVLSEKYKDYLLTLDLENINAEDIMSVEEYDEWLMANNTEYSRAATWQQTAGFQIRKTIAFWAGLFSP